MHFPINEKSSDKKRVFFLSISLPLPWHFAALFLPFLQKMSESGNECDGEKKGKKHALNWNGKRSGEIKNPPVIVFMPI